jgi:hypothetical protein
MTKKKTDHAISSYVQKDLQNVAIAVGFDMVYQVGTTTDAGKKDMLYRLYHGDADDVSANISLVDQLLKGYGKFQSLFHKVPVACNNGNTPSTRIQLQLKDCLTGDGSLDIFVGKHITHHLLISKGLMIQCPT